ncbi:MAG: hypothetical protein V1708_06145 [Candidatus Micrarchaeota archaeon]
MGLPLGFAGMEVPRIAWMAAGVILLCAIAAQANSDLNNATYQAKSWMSPVVTKAESKALSWVVQNTRERDVFLTDIFGGEHIMGNTLREGTEGGDWAIVPDVVARMGKIDEFYSPRTPSRRTISRSSTMLRSSLCRTGRFLPGSGGTSRRRARCSSRISRRCTGMAACRFIR